MRGMPCAACHAVSASIANGSASPIRYSQARTAEATNACRNHRPRMDGLAFWSYHPGSLDKPAARASDGQLTRKDLLAHMAWWHAPGRPPDDESDPANTACYPTD